MINGLYERHLLFVMLILRPKRPLCLGPFEDKFLSLHLRYICHIYACEVKELYFSPSNTYFMKYEEQKPFPVRNVLCDDVVCTLIPVIFTSIKGIPYS